MTLTRRKIKLFARYDREKTAFVYVTMGVFSDIVYLTRKQNREARKRAKLIQSDYWLSGSDGLGRYVVEVIP